MRSNARPSRRLLSGDSVMVAAPTGTGKTVVAEFGVWEAFKRTGRVIYTTPIKALSNQKYRDLRAIYGDQVGLLTGDVSENRDARVVIMTTEVLRNMLLQTPWDLDDVDTVIFDEIHYLADPERGTTWEESIILCPDHVQLICLSATINNADEIAAWISRTHRPIRLITHTERAVPLALHYFIDGKLNLVVDHTGAKVRDFPHTGGELRRQAARGGFARQRAERSTPEMDEPQPREIVDALAAKDMLPAIYFLFSRNDCQAFAERLAVMRPNLVTERQVGLIDQTIEAILAGMRPEDRELQQVQTMIALARKGIGFHHAGLLPILKQLVEVLFTRGLMEVVFATDTLALGINMPARTVVIGRMSKWDGRRRRMLIPNEFQQMAGRAGRRGMDPFGHVVVPYSPWFTFRETLDIATGELHPVQSAFAIRYNTVLNLWDPPARGASSRPASAEPRPIPVQPAHSRPGRSDHRPRRGDRSHPAGLPHRSGGWRGASRGLPPRQSVPGRRSEQGAPVGGRAVKRSPGPADDYAVDRARTPGAPPRVPFGPARHDRPCA